MSHQQCDTPTCTNNAAAHIPDKGFVCLVCAPVDVEVHS